MKIALVVVSLLAHLVCFPQFKIPTSLKKGDRFIKETWINSNAVLQEGAQVIDAAYRSKWEQTITIDNINNSGYLVEAVTTSVKDSITSLGKQHYYNSEDFNDSNSLIEQKIKDILKSPIGVAFEANKIRITKTIAIKEPVFILAGLDVLFENPESFALIIDFPFDSSFSTGYRWTTSDTINNRKTVTTFILTAKSKHTTSFSFNSAISEEYTNTNTNGTLVIDARNGVILERVSQSITVGYEWMNGVLCALDRRTAMVERYSKEKN